MRIFDHPNMTDFVCPICKTSHDLPVTLVGIAGTQDGYICEAVQIHVDCIDLMIDGNIIYQVLGNARIQ